MSKRAEREIKIAGCGCRLKLVFTAIPGGADFSGGKFTYCKMHAAAKEMLKLCIEAENDIRQRALPDKEWLAKVRKAIAEATAEPSEPNYEIDLGSK